jgi:hypothetical protein
MQVALINDMLTPATPDAPPTAACPRCGHPVDLRQRLGTWFWRHQRGAPASCSGRRDTAPYHQTAASGTVDHGLGENLDDICNILDTMGARGTWILRNSRFVELSFYNVHGERVALPLPDGGLFLVARFPMPDGAPMDIEVRGVGAAPNVQSGPPLGAGGRGSRAR